MAAVSGCHRSPSPDVMATVNGKDILRSDLEKYYKANLGDNPQKPSAEQADIVRLNILKQMIDDEILWQRAAKLNLAASDEDVNAKLTEMKAPYTQEELDKQLQARNITLDDLKRDLRRSLTKTKLLNKEIESKINITDAEITSYYAAHKSEFNSDRAAVPSGADRGHQRGRAADRQPAEQQGLRRRRRQKEDSEPAHTPGKRRGLRRPGHELLRESQHRRQWRRHGLHSRDRNCAANRMSTTPSASSSQGEITDILPVYDSAGAGRRTVGYAIYKLISQEPAGQRELNDPRVQQVIRQGLRESHAQLLQNAYFEVLHDDAKVHNYFADQILKQGAQ